MSKKNARPLRTVLFCAGTEEAEIRETFASGADAIVIDLEEPCTPINEAVRDKGRALVKRMLAEFPKTGPMVFVRVQRPATGQTMKDLRAVLCDRLDGILVPKIDSPADVHMTEGLLNSMEVDAGLPMGKTQIYPILETAQALRRAYKIGKASKRICYMGGAISRFGDIHQAIGFRVTPDARETLVLRSKALMDARAAGIRYPIGGMWTGKLNDEAGLRAWCTELRNIGYYGMMIGDPRLVPVVHEIFSPTKDELDYWLRLDRLQTEAERTGADKILDGDPNMGEAHVVHGAHVESARKNLIWARELGFI
jgi:citrate lyase subunit beta/citryl-CoA lyase